MTFESRKAFAAFENVIKKPFSDYGEKMVGSRHYLVKLIRYPNYQHIQRTCIIPIEYITYVTL